MGRSLGCQGRIKRRDSAWAWVTLVASTLVHFCSFGFLNNFGILFNYFLTEFKATKQKTAWVGSIPMFLMHVLAWAANWITLKYGLRATTIVAAIPLGACLIVTSFSSNLDQMLFTFSVPFGLAGSILLISSTSAVYKYFDKRTPIAFGLFSGGSVLGQIGLTYTLIAILDSFGWQRTLQILGPLLSIICILAALTYLPTDFEELTEESENLHGKANVKVYVSLLRNRRFLVFVMANILAGFSYCVTSVHQVQFAVELGVPRDLSKQFPVFSAAGNALGRLCSGFVLNTCVWNTIGYYRGALLLAGLVSIFSSFLTSQAQLIAYILVHSFLEGQLNASAGITVKALVGLNAVSQAYSLLMSVVAAPVMLGPPLLGFIVDKTKNYRAFFYVAGVPYLLASLMLLTLRCTKETPMNEEVRRKIVADNKSLEAISTEDEEVNRILIFETAV